MPRFFVMTSETIYRRGVIEAESREAIHEMAFEDMDLEDYDSSAELIDLEEIT